ncbi:MAG: hypothetical protein ACUVTZ_11390 [Armatimonadota bacterium]
MVCTYCEAETCEWTGYLDPDRNPICEECYTKLLDVCLRHTDAFTSVSGGMRGVLTCLISESIRYGTHHGTARA